MKSLSLLLLLAGCAIPTLPTPAPVNGDKAATVSCTLLTYMTGRVITTYAVLDKDVVISGSVAVDTSGDSCRMVISNSAPAASAP